MTTNQMPRALEDDDPPPVYRPRTGARVVIDKITGYPVVTARPGVPKITTEDVQRLLEDFP